HCSADGPLVLFFYPRRPIRCVRPRRATSVIWHASSPRPARPWAGISRDAVEKQASFARAQEFDYPLLADVDGTVAQQFGVRRGLLGRITPSNAARSSSTTDRTVLEVISSELRANLHADRALEFLRSRA
ncbi:redoxin domain-containing protein, partial [Rhodococcus hoagii]|nr:redoxin domain-containing protein [Prescottella equi]